MIELLLWQVGVDHHHQQQQQVEPSVTKGFIARMPPPLKVCLVWAGLGSTTSVNLNKSTRLKREKRRHTHSVINAVAKLHKQPHPKGAPHILGSATAAKPYMRRRYRDL